MKGRRERERRKEPKWVPGQDQVEARRNDGQEAEEEEFFSSGYQREEMAREQDTIEGHRKDTGGP